MITFDGYYISAQNPLKAVCQDHCFYGLSPIPHMILSDGCSSSKNSEIGAMVLSHSVIRLLYQIKEKFENCDYYSSVDIYNFINDNILLDAYDIINGFNLSVDSLYATLIVSIVLGGQIHTMMWGDGHIIVVNHDNDIIYHKTIDFPYNAPYFISYNLPQNKDVHNNYIKNIGGKSITVNNETKLVDIKTKDITTFNLDDIQYLMITSDGIESFRDIDTKIRVSPIKVVNELVNFKLTDGEFVQSRVKKMFKDFQKKNQYNYDDFSCVCMYNDGMNSYVL